MPRSRSMSIRSRYCARIARASTTPVICSIRSASVDLPWSMWAMMQKFRISSGGVACGCSAVRAMGDTGFSNLTGRRGRIVTVSHAPRYAGDAPPARASPRRTVPHAVRQRRGPVVAPEGAGSRRRRRRSARHRRCAPVGSAPHATRREPPARKNGIGSVAGWPWLPGIGLGSRRVAEPPARLAVDDQVSRLGTQPQVGGQVARQHARHSPDDLTHPGHGGPVGVRPGPVEQVGATVLRDLHAAGEQRVGLEAAASETTRWAPTSPSSGRRAR